MSSLGKKVKSIQGAWKQFVLLGTWIATIAGTFLLPLPDWNLGNEQVAHTRFILFGTTVIAGFILLLTYKYKNNVIWVWGSVGSFVLLVVSFYLYSSKRETNTLPYYGETRIIGNVPLDEFDERISSCGFDRYDKDILKCVGGNTILLWTQKSINRNKNELIAYYTISNGLLSVFLISFLHLILTIPKTKKTVQGKRKST